MNEPALNYASFWKRFYAYGYDSLIVAVLAYVLSMAVGNAAAQDMDALLQQLQAMQALSGQTSDPAALVNDLMQSLTEMTRNALLVSAPYNILFVASGWQATPGKRFCGIRVVNTDGSRLNLLQSTLRHAASGLSVAIGGLGFLPIFFTKEKTALHDMICNTRVIL